MYKVVAAETYIACPGTGMEHIAVRVTLDKPFASISHNFEKRQIVGSKIWIYRAELGDAVRYFSYEGPGKGFGGHVFALHMKGGSHEKLVGPWSTRASVVNAMFPDREPCIECDLTNHAGSVDVKVSALEAFGIKFNIVHKRGEERYEPCQPSDEQFLDALCKQSS